MAVGWYIWRDGGPVAVDVMEWAVQRGSEPVKPTGEVPSSMHVAETRLWDGPNEVRISTVFLGLDHNHGPGAPILFETMLFWPGDESDEDMMRYHTLEEAEGYHQRWVIWCQEKIALKKQGAWPPASTLVRR